MGVRWFRTSADEPANGRSLIQRLLNFTYATLESDQRNKGDGHSVTSCRDSPGSNLEDTADRSLLKCIGFDA